MTTTTPKTILFLGATGGVGLAALKRALAAGHTCIALCRTPSKLATLVSPSSPDAVPANLRLEQGNAHDVDAIARCLVVPATTTTAASSTPSDGHPRRLVDTVISSIGAYPTLRGMSDPHVCEKGMNALLAALRRVRAEGLDDKVAGRPRIVGVSSTGISDAGRDIPLLMVPLYKGLLHTPHADKKAMEKLMERSGEAFVIVRGSFYTDGPATEGKVRVGVEDPVAGVVVRKEKVGYTISREDVGEWIYENCIEGGDEYVGKAVMITY